MFISGYANTGKKFSIAFIILYNFPEKKKNSLFSLLIKREILTSREVLYTKLNVRVLSSCFAIKMLSKRGFFSLKIASLSKKKNWHSIFVKIFQASSDEGMGKKSNFVKFSAEKLFKIRACVISPRKAKHLDSTHGYIISWKHISQPIRARAYYLSYSLNVVISCAVVFMA